MNSLYNFFSHVSNNIEEGYFPQATVSADGKLNWHKISKVSSCVMITNLATALFRVYAVTQKTMFVPGVICLITFPIVQIPLGCIYLSRYRKNARLEKECEHLIELRDIRILNASKTALDLTSNKNSTLFPNEILLHIFSYLEAKDLCQLCLVNKTFLKIASNDHLWNKAGKIFFKDRWSYQLGQSQESAKGLYAKLYITIKLQPKINSAKLKLLNSLEESSTTTPLFESVRTQLKKQQ